MRYGFLSDATQTMVAKIDDDTYQVQVVSWHDKRELLHLPRWSVPLEYFAENLISEGDKN